MLIQVASLTVAVTMIFLTRPNPGYPDTSREKVTVNTDSEKHAIQLTRAELEEDAQFALTTIEEVHPGLMKIGVLRKYFPHRSPYPFPLF